MKKILIALWYIAGVIVGSKFADKGKSTVKSKSSKNDNDITEQVVDAGKEFVQTHKNVFDEIKKEYWTPHNKKLLLSKKEDLMKFFDLIKDEVTDTIAELKENWIHSDEIQKKIESIYDEKSNILQKLGNSATVVAAKKKLNEMIRDTKKALKK